MKYKKGITLVELLIYIALLSALIVTSFSIAFVLGRDKDFLSNLVERQYYSISFLEYSRLTAKNGEIYSPNMHGTTSVLITSNGNVPSGKHVFIYLPENITFSREESNVLNVNGTFMLRASTTREFTMPIYVR